jgi:hypothetical protein
MSARQRPIEQRQSRSRSRLRREGEQVDEWVTSPDQGTELTYGRHRMLAEGQSIRFVSVIRGQGPLNTKHVPSHACAWARHHSSLPVRGSASKRMRLLEKRLCAGLEVEMV